MSIGRLYSLIFLVRIELDSYLSVKSFWYF